MIASRAKLLITALLLSAISASATATECRMSVSDLPFDPYNPFANVDSTATGEVELRCTDDGTTETVNYSLALSGGNSGDPANRFMSDGFSQLIYNAYIDPGFTVVWGDGSAGTTTVDGSITPPASGEAIVRHLVYGRLPAGQSGINSGEYNDALILQINF